MFDGMLSVLVVVLPVVEIMWLFSLLYSVVNGIEL